MATSTSSSRPNIIVLLRPVCSPALVLSNRRRPRRQWPSWSKSIGRYLLCWRISLEYASCVRRLRFVCLTAHSNVSTAPQLGRSTCHFGSGFCAISFCYSHTTRTKWSTTFWYLPIGRVLFRMDSHDFQWMLAYTSQTAVIRDLMMQAGCHRESALNI